MNLEEIKQRADDVINGFKQPNERLAKDVITLLAEIKRMQRVEAAKAFKSVGGNKDDGLDFLKSTIFGNKR